MDPNSSVCRRLTLALTQVPEISKKLLHTGTAIGLALNLTVVVFSDFHPHTRCLQALHMGNSGDTRQPSAWPPERRSVLWVYPETSPEYPPARLATVPQDHRPVCELMLRLTQPEPRPPVSHLFYGPHILQVGHAWPEVVMSNQPGYSGICLQNGAQIPAHGGS